MIYQPKDYIVSCTGMYSAIAKNILKTAKVCWCQCGRFVYHFCSFCLDHCIVCLSIYQFWLPYWYIYISSIINTATFLNYLSMDNKSFQQTREERKKEKQLWSWHSHVDRSLRSSLMDILTFLRLTVEQYGFVTWYVRNCIIIVVPYVIETKPMLDILCPYRSQFPGSYSDSVR